MTKVKATNVYGFEVDEPEFDPRVYDLPSGQHIIVGKETGKVEVVLETGNNHDSEDHNEFFQTLESAVASGLEVIAAVDTDFNGIHAKEAEKNLASRLQTYEGIVKSKFDTLYLGKFNEPEYVMLLAQCSELSELDQFLDKCLKAIDDDAKRSLKKKKPNYRIRTPKLLESIGEYLGKEIKAEVPEIIEGFTPFNTEGIESLVNNSNYVRALVQENGSSFTYDLEMQNHVRKLTRKMRGDLEKSKAIFDWITSNIKYGKKKRNPSVGYRGALQAYKDREGVCGESAALQVTMERLAGNIAFLVEVDKGEVGITPTRKIVTIPDSHACAAHLRPTGEVILIDTTNPEGFGIKYDNFRIVSDEHSLAKY